MVSTTTSSLVALLAAAASLVSAQNCISLAGSTQCPAFNSSSVSTDAQLVGLFPFLSGVTSTDSFDQALSSYINNTYVQTKYQQLLGCTRVNLSNTTSYYARYTTSVICNAIIQNSIQPCGLSGAAITPLCADSCASFAINEEEIVTNQDLCGTQNQDYVPQIRADFTNCALPADSLTGECIPAEQNEPNECGFSTNVAGLCGYCAASSPNATDSCCINSDVNQRCQGVTLPSLVTSLPPIFSVSATSTPAASANQDNSGNRGLSGGAIAGIVIGVVVGVALIALLIALLVICLRRRRGSQHGSIFNQPSPKREPVVRSAPGSRSLASRDHSQPTVGGRVTRMTALSNEDGYDAGMEKGFDSGDEHFYDAAGPLGAATGGTTAAAAAIRQGKRAEVGRRRASLNSVEMLGAGIPEERESSSPQPGGLSSSGENGQAPSGQSEQLPYFKDYYSSDDIYPGSRVSVLWGYQPRAGDEFELQRGDMLKVVGIWDDGWATGVQIDDRAEQYLARLQRDSGVSHGGSDRADSPIPEGDVKAFPLVCVCLPQHWQKTIDGSESASPPTEA